MFIDWRLSERKVQMLRNLGIRWQILSALALPVLVLALISSQVTYQALLDMRDASQSRDLANAGTKFSRLVDGLGTERALSAEVLLGIPGTAPQLKLARAAVDRDLNQLRSQVNVVSTSDDSDVQAVVARIVAEDSQIPSLRAAVDSGKSSPREIVTRYSQLVEVDANVPFDLADTIKDKQQAANFRQFGDLGLAIEALAQEQLAGASAILAGKPGLVDQRDLGAAESAGQVALANYQQAAPSDLRLVLQAALAAPAARTADLAAARAQLQAAGTDRRPNLTLTDWTTATTAQMTAIRTVFDRISENGVALATDDYNSARTKLQLTLGGALGITVLTLLLALGLSRRVSAPLRRLTQAATQIRDELPRLVQSLQTDEDVELELPVVSVVGRNEVSRLAAAFVDVNAVTVRIAREQARLRSAVADMFVNVARRNHVLLSRQLAFIDQLERNEVNPDALEELFRLDHLATRMRRNAESLLVLAGIESGRRLREPMPLSDVVRTAMSEIEHYSRVSPSLAIDPPLYAHLALPVAHLLAELLENATNFSDPGSSVVVMTTPTEHGVRMTVADDGLGMSDAELRDINARISEPPTAEALSSQRLGFFVVGRLAHRLEATVTLTSGRARGTAVLIDLPAALFIPGALDGLGLLGSGLQPAGFAPPQPAVLPAAVPAQSPAQSSAPGSGPLDAPELSPLLGTSPAVTSPDSPFADAYAAVSAPAAPTAPTSPTPPQLPAAFNTDAMVAEAAAEPTWMPQPDALPFGATPAPAAGQGASAPLARRNVTPPVDPAAAPAPVALATRTAPPSVPAQGQSATDWAESEWAGPGSAAPASGAGPATPGPAGSPAGGPEPSAGGGSSLFSGFRSRREGVAAESPVAAGGPEAAPPIALAPAATPSAEPAQAFGSGAAPATLAPSFADSTSLSQDIVPPVAFAPADPTSGPAREHLSGQDSGAGLTAPNSDGWDSAGSDSAGSDSAGSDVAGSDVAGSDGDRWQTWAEVSAENGVPADSNSMTDDVVLSPLWNPEGAADVPRLAPPATPALDIPTLNTQAPATPALAPVTPTSATPTLAPPATTGPITPEPLLTVPADALWSPAADLGTDVVTAAGRSADSWAGEPAPAETGSWEAEPTWAPDPSAPTWAPEPGAPTWAPESATPTWEAQSQAQTPAPSWSSPEAAAPTWTPEAEAPTWTPEPSAPTWTPEPTAPTWTPEPAAGETGTDAPQAYSPPGGYSTQPPTYAPGPSGFSADPAAQVAQVAPADQVGQAGALGQVAGVPGYQAAAPAWEQGAVAGTDEAETTEWTPESEAERVAGQAPRRPGEELRARTLTAAIDILPQRTTIRTALRRGRRKSDSPLDELPFNGGFDPIAPAREFARREGFLDSSSSQSPVSTGLPAELNGIPAVAGSISTLPEPTRSWDSAGGGHVERRQHPRPTGGQEEGRSALASEALSELSRLSSYSPTSMATDGASGLQRRQPGEVPAEEAVEADQPVSTRTRTAASVRSMLAGFKAGVERGRTSPSANRPAPERDSGGLPAPRTPAGRDE